MRSEPTAVNCPGVSHGGEGVALAPYWRAAIAACAMLWFGQVVSPSVLSAQERLALVVGNSSYSALGALSNPSNDARDVAAALGRLGFSTTTVLDAKLTELNGALRAFGRRTRGADVALVFYAGHGIELNGENYLVPVDAQLELDTDVRYETVTLDNVLAATAGAALQLVILDACRNNPLAGDGRSISRGSLGAPEEERLGTEVLVAYAARAGTVALDGRGQRNSPYTAALLAYLEQPLELNTMFRRVRGQVLEATGRRQEPWEYGALVGDHYLRATRRLSPRDVESALGLDLEARRMVQVGLVAAGYAAGAPDGEFGVRTREAIREWQVARGLPATGYLNDESASLLREVASGFLSILRGDNAPTEVPVARPNVVDRSRTLADGEVFRDNCEGCPEMVVVPAGRFRMGCVSGRACGGDERPVHEVEVSSFALGVYEVTFEEYDRFVQATGHRRAGDHGWGRGRRPVVDVSWNDAVAYASWLSEETGESYRLPSESEWEYAARAGSTTRYSWGQDIGRNRANCDGCGSRWDADETAPAGSFAANGWGVHDMHGNVWEWVADCWHENYARAPRDGTAWTRGGNCGRRVLRGGSWNNVPAILRSAYRINYDAGARSVGFGFRVSRTLD